MVNGNGKPMKSKLSGFHEMNADEKLELIKKFSDLTDEEAEVMVTVMNTGQYAGEDVVQLYIKDVEATVRVPLYSLKGFTRVTLKPGESKTIEFTITPEMLKLINDKGESVLE